jgi:hypothetical protein
MLIRQYDETDNIRVLHHFKNDELPVFQIIVDKTVTAVECILYDINGEEVFDASSQIVIETDTNLSDEAYSRLIMPQYTISTGEEGAHYYKLTYTVGGVDFVIYSDVFCWDEDVSDYLKIEAESSVFSIGNFKVNTESGSPYLVYLECNRATPEYEIEEEGVEKTYGDIPLNNTRRKSEKYEITGYKITLDFLAGLRTLWTNGKVTMTYRGEEFEIFDIEEPDVTDDYSYGDIIIMTINFKRKDFIQTINE